MAGKVYLAPKPLGTEAMAVTPGKFNMLRKKLQNDTDLNAIMNYFYDHFADHEEFVKMCEPIRHEDLESLLPTVIRGV
ncbi:MAG: hypothetical protein ACK4NB_01565, partial [Fimbriimonadales bacterium]